MALTPASVLADYSSGIGTQGATLKVNTSDKRVGIGTTNPQGTLQVGTGITMGSGIITATAANFSGNLTVGGVLTYEDVTNVDSVGVITARQGIRIGAGQSIGSDGAEVVYYGNGFNLTGIDATAIKDSAGGTVRVQANTSGAVVTGILTATTLEQTQTYPTIRPTLDLNFAITKSLDRRITFTRDGVGTYTDELGVLKYSSNNVPRFDHDPITGESLGLLIEESRTNLVEYGDFTAGWTEYGGTATSTTETTAPDGTFTAKKITSKGDQSTSGIYDSIQYTSNTTYTHTMWLKAGTVTTAGLTVNSGSTWTGTNYPYITVNLSTGAVTASGGVSAKVTEYPNGWYRLEATGTFAGNTQVDAIWVHSQTGSSMVGNTTDYYYVWGPQAEEGNFGSSYIPTAGTTVTRGADLAKITGNNFSSLYNENEGVFFASGILNTNWSTAQYTGIFGAGEGGNMNFLFVNPNNSFGYYIKKHNGSSVTLNSTYVTGTKYSLAGSYDSTGFSQCFNGTLSTSNSTEILTSAATFSMTIGGHANNQFVKGSQTISRVTYYPKRLPNAQLQGLTA